MISGLEKLQGKRTPIIHIDRNAPTSFYSLKQLETQLFRYQQKEMTIKLIGDYLLSLKPWTRNEKEPKDWKWSAYLEQTGYQKGIMLRISKQLFLDDTLKPEEFFKKPVQSPIIHRVLSSIQSGRSYRNQNLFYLVEPNFK